MSGKHDIIVIYCCGTHCADLTLRWPKLLALYGSNLYGNLAIVLPLIENIEAK